MATLQNIRKRGPLVALAVGFALLAFILGDFLSQGRSFLGNAEREVANIAGESVPIEAFNSRFQGLLEVQEIQSGGRSVDTRMQEQLRRQVWDEILRDVLLSEEYEELGIAISEEELFDLVQGQNIDPMIQQAFSNPQTGQFNREDVLNFLQNMELDESGQSKTMWLYLEDQILNKHLFQKYTTLISKGLYVTSSEAEANHEAQNHLVDFDYIMLAYADLPDSAYATKISDQQIEAYYEEHKHFFKQQEEIRNVEYVAFDVEPSEADEQRIVEEITELKDNFRKTTDVVAFVNANSDKRFDPTHYKRGELMHEIDTLMFNADTSEVVIYGPYKSAGTYRLTRLVERVEMPDSVQASHILIQPDGQEITLPQAHLIIDSLKQLVDNGADFAELARANSMDGSAAEGGDLGWFDEGQMVKPFSDACFNNEVGAVVKVETQFGVHLIKVTGHTEAIPKVQVATIELKIYPSDETRRDVYREASDFATSIGSYNDFITQIEERNLSKRLANNIMKNSPQILGIENSRQLIQRTYQTEEAKQLITDFENNPVFELGDRFIVAMLVEIRPEGYSTPDMENVRNRIVSELVKEEKAKELKRQFESASGAGSMTDLAVNINSRVQEAKNMQLLARQLPGVGPEPTVLAQAVAMEKGVRSKPIEGDYGVYVIEVTSVTPPTEKEEYTTERSTLMQQLQSRATYEPFEALKKSAEIVDKRYKFF